MNRKAKGSRRERQALHILEKLGFLVTKAGASLGAFDLIAIKDGLVKCVQVKSNRPPGKVERGTLADLAKRLTGQAQLSLELWVFKDGIKAPIITQL